MPRKLRLVPTPSYDTEGFRVVAQARILRDLNVAGYIDQYTVWVGMQILARMNDTMSPTVTITQIDIADTWISYKGEVLARPVPINAVKFTRALQELQQVAGMVNALTPSGLSDCHEDSHFTQDPRMPTPAFTPSTPIYVRGDTDSQAHIRNFIDTDINAAMFSSSREMPIG